VSIPRSIAHAERYGSHAKEQKIELALLIQDFPALPDHEWFQEIAVVF
jgi:hypothetical protein